MPTNKVVLRTVEEFMSDFVPTYNPLYPLFLGKSQQYETEAGERKFRRVDTVGDIRAKHISPKDTEIKQIAVTEGTKTFKKYFLSNQFRLSTFQDRQGIEEVTAQVLDEHNKQMDDLFLLGEGTSTSTMLNNGLFWSNDANYTLENSVQVSKDSDSNHIVDLHTRVMTTAQKANQVAGRKIIVFYGSSILPVFNSVYSNGVRPFKTVLQEVLGSNYSLVQMPSSPTPSNTNGWIVANMDQCKLHYTVLPELEGQGINEEQRYLWMNFLMGSSMLEVLALNGIIRQPATLEA